ncbi:Peptide methionine sulfoxide reductase [Phytophthora cactorum]|nr:Peptide methionine sulfoxide reductase [Phytophthora cactorum]
MAGKTAAKPPISAPPAKKRKVASSSSVPLIIQKEISADEVVNAHELVSQTDEFYEKYWEQRPLAIKRNFPSYYDGWFSKQEIDRILKTHTLEYGTDLDLTNPSPVPPEVLGRCLEAACHTRGRMGLHGWCQYLLDPKNTQGFAPHFDDIEAFLLQTEGCKHWKVYQPLNESDMLARYPSGNYKPEELGKPVLEVDLEQGDLLYFPRGFIHQARAHKEKHSLHLTVSTGQQNSMGNFLEVLLPQALAGAINTNVELRRSLPRDYLEYMGVMHSDRQGDPERQAFANKLKGVLKTVLGEAMGMLDAASDQMAKNFLVDRLPPALEDEEENCTSDNSPLQKITVNTQLKLVRHGVARLVIEDSKAVLYHCRENSRMHHEVPISPLEFELDDAESIEFILSSYPDYFRAVRMPVCCSAQVKALADEAQSSSTDFNLVKPRFLDFHRLADESKTPNGKKDHHSCFLFHAFHQKDVHPVRGSPVPLNPPQSPVSPLHSSQIFAMADNQLDNNISKPQSVATFAAGCFWGVQLAFDRLPGVLETTVGYTQGDVDSPTYRQVCTGRTNHAEAIRIVFDESQTSYESLLSKFWAIHDPTTLNRQKNDKGTQYRSGIYYHSEDQRKTALASKEEYQKKLSNPIVTEIVEAKQFWDAEDYHQKYLEKGGQCADKGCEVAIRCYG